MSPLHSPAAPNEITKHHHRADGVCTPLTFCLRENPMKHATPLLCLLSRLVGACADGGANYTPILDGPPTAAFRSDLSDCQALARDQRQFNQETAGALVGGVASAVNASERREAIVVECLRGRGHGVVG